MMEFVQDQIVSPIQLDELRAIRNELMARIAMQNILLVLSVVAFAVLTTIGLSASELRWPLCAVHAVVGFALALQWCHQGVRIMQIKKYILTLEPPTSHSWENWLPANRPKRLLGTRWLVSTKGVFLGNQLAAIGFAASSSPWTRTESVFCVVAIGLFASTAGFLFTNPKE